MFYEFETITHGKWILAGEHAVLRGKGALVFPIPEKQLHLQYQVDSNQLHADFHGSSKDVLQLLFWSVLEHGQQLLGQSLHNLTGYFQLTCNIPVGVGLGASAALCVAMARWFEAQGLLIQHSVTEFAQTLENLFHGKSSGLDIAGVAAQSGLYFQQGQADPLTNPWQPHWYLSSCGQIGVTSHCINQVKAIWEQQPEAAQQIDTDMEKAVQQARLALQNQNESALHHLRDAIRLSADCFNRWGLVSETLSRHMNMLMDGGALATKPTGSGGGGYVVSLWAKPPENQSIEFIAI